jgi:mono/diheme cytochrome c family protein
MQARMGTMGAMESTSRRRAFQAGLAVLFLLPAGCQQQMASQPSYKPLDPSTFYPDGRSARPLVAGTVPRGHLRTDVQLFAGTRHRVSRAPVNGPWAQALRLLGGAGAGPLGFLATLNTQEDFVATFPFPITEDVMKRGHDRYMIYCVVCHDALGTGHGKIVERGYTPPPTYHSDRLRTVAVGHLFAVITEGYGSMPDYREQVPPRDRWAIVAYIRALQLSQHFPEKNMTPDMREKRKEQQPGGAGGKAE